MKIQVIIELEVEDNVDIQEAMRPLIGRPLLRGWDLTEKRPYDACVVTRLVAELAPFTSKD